MTRRCSSHVVLGILIFLIILFYFREKASVVILEARTGLKTNYKQQNLGVDFTETRNVEELNSGTYQQFILRLREDLRKLPGASVVPCGVPALPPQDDAKPIRWFELKLQGRDGSETTLRFRGDNLYLVGFQTQNPKQWYELGKTGDKQYITGSKLLGYRGSYAEMVGQAGVKSLYKVSLTKKTLSKAVATLATFTNKNEVAEALIIMAQMISEACRFIDVSNRFTSEFERPTESFLPVWMYDDVEKNWSDLSTIPLCAEKYKKKYEYKPVKINGQNIPTLADLCARLGILLRARTNEKDCGIKKKEEL